MGITENKNATNPTLQDGIKHLQTILENGDFIVNTAETGSKLVAEDREQGLRRYSFNVEVFYTEKDE